MKSTSAFKWLAAIAAAFTVSTAAQAAAPLKIGYSDWPGWVAWEIAVQKGWFKEAGVDVDFEWFEYVPSMEAFAAGKIDAVCMTNGDALVTGATGAPSKAILINDFSNGNDKIVAACKRRTKSAAGAGRKVRHLWCRSKGIGGLWSRLRLGVDFRSCEEAGA